MSLGGSTNKQKSSSSSSGVGFGVDQSQTYIDPVGQQQQQALFNQYQGAQLGQTPGLESARGYGMGAMRGLANNVGQFAGNMAQAGNYGALGLAQFAQQDNPYLQNQINGLAQDAGQFYREQILPGIGSNAQLAGQRGSSRQGIAEALGAQRVGQEFAQAAGDMRMQAYGQQQNAMQGLAGLGIQGANQGYGLQGAAINDQGQLANQFAQTGLQAQMQPFQIGSQVIGAPQILSQSLGLDYRQQQSQSQGSGSGYGMNIGFV